jgi:hypothetical protein
VYWLDECQQHAKTCWRGKDQASTSEGVRVRPESFDGISMTCSVAGDRYSWYAANKAKQFQWQHPWWYPQVIEMTPNVSGQTLRNTS